MKIVITIAMAVGLYFTCFVLTLLHGILVAIGRAGGEIDPIGFICFSVPIIILHSILMYHRGKIPLFVSSLFLAGLYYSITHGAYTNIMDHLHPDYVKVKGHVPPFDARQWLNLSTFLPLVAVSTSIPLLFIKGNTSNQIVQSTPLRVVTDD
jgi:hypothetical protein